MKAALHCLILGSLFGLVVWLLLILPQSRWLENLWLDACFVTRGPRKSTVRDTIVLIGLDKESLANLGKRAGLISPELETVVKYLMSYQVNDQRTIKAIGIDLLIPEPEKGLFRF